MMKVMGTEITKEVLATMIKGLDEQIARENEIPPEPKISKGFTVKCNECGNEVVITEKNMGDYFKGFRWNRFAKREDIRDKILISYTEDCEADSISCTCENII
jgi:hypothetical protein